MIKKTGYVTQVKFHSYTDSERQIKKDMATFFLNTTRKINGVKEKHGYPCVTFSGATVEALRPIHPEVSTSVRWSVFIKDITTSVYEGTKRFQLIVDSVSVPNELPPSQGQNQPQDGYNQPQGGYNQAQGSQAYNQPQDGYNQPQGGYNQAQGSQAYNQPQDGYNQPQGGYNQAQGSQAYNQPQAVDDVPF